VNCKGNTSYEWPFIRKEKVIEIMSAEEFDKTHLNKPPIPKGLERAIAKLAKNTVEKDLDPAKVLFHLMRMMQAWNTLSQEQRDGIRAELLRRRKAAKVVNRKPRRQNEI
jgi:hypothetical protein